MADRVRLTPRALHRTQPGDRRAGGAGAGGELLTLQVVVEPVGGGHAIVLARRVVHPDGRGVGPQHAGGCRGELPEQDIQVELAADRLGRTDERCLRQARLAQRRAHPREAERRGRVIAAEVEQRELVRAQRTLEPEPQRPQTRVAEHERALLERRVIRGPLGHPVLGLVDQAQTHRPQGQASRGSPVKASATSATSRNESRRRSTWAAADRARMMPRPVLAPRPQRAPDVQPLRATRAGRRPLRSGRTPATWQARGPERSGAGRRRHRDDHAGVRERDRHRVAVAGVGLDHGHLVTADRRPNPLDQQVEHRLRRSMRARPPPTGEWPWRGRCRVARRAGPAGACRGLRRRAGRRCRSHTTASAAAAATRGPPKRARSATCRSRARSPRDAAAPPTASAAIAHTSAAPWRELRAAARARAFRRMPDTRERGPRWRPRLAGGRHLAPERSKGTTWLRRRAPEAPMGIATLRSMADARDPDTTPAAGASPRLLRRGRASRRHRRATARAARASGLRAQADRAQHPRGAAARGARRGVRRVRAGRARRRHLRALGALLSPSFPLKCRAAFVSLCGWLARGEMPLEKVLGAMKEAMAESQTGPSDYNGPACGCGLLRRLVHPARPKPAGAEAAIARQG